MVEKVHKFNSHCQNVCFGIGKKEKPMKVEEKKLSYLQNKFFFFPSIWTPTFKAPIFSISSSF